MTHRKFFKTTYVVEILSEEPIPPDMDLKDVMAEAYDGGYSGDVKSEETVEVDGATMASLLTEQRSSPGFFRLTDDGNDMDMDDDDTDND